MASNYDLSVTGTFDASRFNSGCGCPRCQERSGEEAYYLKRKIEYLERELYFRRSVEITKPKANMNKLTILAKKLLDADTKVFVKAGILDESLEITDEGVDFLLAQYLADNKERLAAAAKELIKEEEAAKK